MDDAEKYLSDDEHQVLLAASPSAIVLGRNVTRLRKEAKITKYRFALMIGVGRPFLNRIENGTADPRLSIIEKLAEALDSTPLELLHETDTTKTKRLPLNPSGHARL